MAKKMGERGFIYPSLMCGVVKPCGLVKLRGGRQEVGTAFLGWRCSELRTSGPPSTTVSSSDFNRILFPIVLD